jgi:hypothetical protein
LLFEILRPNRDTIKTANVFTIFLTLCEFLITVLLTL